MIKKFNAPRLRFPGFTDEWEQRKLGDIVDFLDDQRKPLKESDRIKGKYPYYGASGIIDYINDYLFDENLVLLSEDGANIIDRNYPVCFIATGKYWVNNHAHVLKVKAGIIDKFICESLERLDYTKFNTGTAQPKLNQDICQKIMITIPNEDEQKCISEFLDRINNIITLHQHKITNLIFKKKALLQKLFPINGYPYPEIRFPGFNDAWEQRKLGEIFEYLQNNTLSRNSLNYKNPNIKNIHYGDILVKFDEILDGSNKDIPYINSELDLSKFSKSLLRDGDVIFSDTAEDDTVGKAIELQNVNEPFILSGLHTIPCRPLITFGKGYLGNFLNSNSYRMQLRPLVQGIKVSSISKSALKDTMIEYPKNLDEQEKIGSLFYHIAKMITLHQRKLNHLKLQKKALLQQLFV